MGSESGQATIEWTGLVLLVAIALGALLTLARPVDGRRLGGSVAHAITCAARGGCAAAGGAPPSARRASPRIAVPAASPGTGRVGSPATSGHAGPGPAPPHAAAPPAPRSADPAALRGARTAAKRLWLLCLGYRRFRYDLEHPRAPMQGVPMSETLDTVNECLNPLSFLVGD